LTFSKANRFPWLSEVCGGPCLNFYKDNDFPRFGNNVNFPAPGAVVPFQYFAAVPTQEFAGLFFAESAQIK